MIFQELRRTFSIAKNAILHPGNNSPKMSVLQALAFYYKALPIPLLMLLLISCLDLALARAGFTAPTFWSPSLANPSGSGSSGLVATPLIPLAYLLTYPLAGILNAAIFQLIAKVFRIWKGNFAGTFTAVIFGLLPVAMFLWILSIPLANLPVNAVTNLLFLAMYLWNAVVTVVSLAAQHAISRRRALVGFIVGMLLIFFTMTFYYNFTITTTITLDTIKAIFG